jgi:exonuclease III
MLQNIDQRNLFDPFRDFFPNLNRYTWRKPTPLKQARLDLFLATETIFRHVKNINIEISCHSDHSIVNMKIKFNDFMYVICYIFLVLRDHGCQHY